LVPIANNVLLFLSFLKIKKVAPITEERPGANGDTPRVGPLRGPIGHRPRTSERDENHMRLRRTDERDRTRS